MQIPASPDETNTTNMLHDLPRQKARNLALHSKLTHQHMSLVALERPHTPPCRPHCSAICKTREVMPSIAFTRTNTRRLRIRILPTHRHDFLMCSSSIGHTRPPIGHVDHRSAYGRNMAFNRCCTRCHTPPRFLTSPPRAGEHRTLQLGAENCY